MGVPLATRAGLAVGCALAAISMLPTLASAQTPADVATQTGALIEQMIMQPAAPWGINGGLSLTVDRGNADSSSASASITGLKDTGVWRLAATTAAERETAQGATLYERYSADVATMRPLGNKFRVVGVVDWHRAPYDGLDHQYAAGGIVVWLPDTPTKSGVGIFGGLLGATEKYTTDTPDAAFAQSLAGASVAYFFTPSTVLSTLFTHSQDLSSHDNYRLGARLKLQSQIVGALGTDITYLWGFDHEPVFGLEEHLHSLNVGLTINLRPSPPPTR